MVVNDSLIRLYFKGWCGSQGGCPLQSHDFCCAFHRRKPKTMSLYTIKLRVGAMFGFTQISRLVDGLSLMMVWKGEPTQKKSLKFKSRKLGKRLHHLSSIQKQQNSYGSQTLWNQIPKCNQNAHPKSCSFGLSVSLTKSRRTDSSQIPSKR